MGSACSKIYHDVQHVDCRCAVVVLPLDATATTSTSRPPPISASDGSSLTHQDAIPLESASRSPSRGLVSAADVVGSSLVATCGARSTALSDGILDACLDARSSFCSTAVSGEPSDPLHCAMASGSAAEEQATAPSHAVVDVSRVASLPQFASYATSGSSVPSHSRYPSHELIEAAMLVESRQPVAHPSDSSWSQSSTLLRHSMFLRNSHCNNSLSSAASAVFRRGRREPMQLPTLTQPWDV